jgi:uracil-DNA glycosylase family 4
MADIVYPASMRKVSYLQENCSSCMLNKNSRLPLYGEGKKGVLIVFEKQESIQQISKTYGVGSKFEFIIDILEDYNMYIDEDCWVTSAIQCYGQTVSQDNADCCKPALQRLINQLKPKLIIALGDITAKVLMSDLFAKEISVDRFHGFLHNNRQYKCNIMITYAPHSVKGDKRPTTIDDLIIKRDIHVAIKSLSSPRIEWKDEKECIHLLNDKQAVEYLKTAISNPAKRYNAFDYESNCLRPYNDDAKLYCVSIADSVDNAVAFMLNDNTIPLFKEWLKTPQICKIAHNSAFERSWSIVKLGVTPVNFKIDTMLLMHVLDNRANKILGIKFLAPVLIGCDVWNAHIEGYLESNKQDKAQHGSYAINSIHKIPLRQLLTYDAIDSLVEFRVFKLLMEWLKTYYDRFPDEE